VPDTADDWTYGQEADGKALRYVAKGYGEYLVSGGGAQAREHRTLAEAKAAAEASRTSG